MRCRCISVLGHLCWIFGVCMLVISLVLSTKTESSVSSSIVKLSVKMPSFYWGGISIGVSIDLQSPKNKKMQLWSAKVTCVLVIFNI